MVSLSRSILSHQPSMLEVTHVRTADVIARSIHAPCIRPNRWSRVQRQSYGASLHWRLRLTIHSPGFVHRFRIRCRVEREAPPGSGAEYVETRPRSVPSTLPRRSSGIPKHRRIEFTHFHSPQSLLPGRLSFWSCMTPQETDLTGTHLCVRVLRDDARDRSRR